MSTQPESAPIIAPGRFVETGEPIPVPEPQRIQPTRNITFRLKLTPDEHARLRTLAEANGQTPAQYVRERIFGENR
jgi:hypothetical protein